MLHYLKNRRYIVAALAALCLLLLIVAPIMKFIIQFPPIERGFTYMDLCGEALHQGEILPAILAIVGFIGVAAAMVSALISAASRRICGSALLVGGFSGAALMILLIIGMSGFADRTESGDILGALLSELAKIQFTFWFYIVLLLLLALGTIGIKLLRNTGVPGSDPQNRKVLNLSGDGTKDAATGIIGVSGEFANAWIPLPVGETLLIGRDPSVCSLIITHQNADISRSHCKIGVNSDGNSYLVTDYSRNGTFWTHAPSGIYSERLPQNTKTPVPRGATLALGRKGNTFRLA